jgi:putative ABC transport system permease protein
VAVLSESAARLLWPGQNPIGKRLIRPFENLGVYWRVVGIVGDVRSGGLDRAPTPLVYRSYEQQGGASFSLVVRTAITPDALATVVREALSRVDADIPVPEIRTIPAAIAESVQQRRFQALLLGAFAFVAVLLAATGIYGVLAYSVLQRRKEIGVRIALGADQHHVRGLILKSGMAPVFAGLGAGLLASTFLARIIASLLFEVSTLDPLTFIGAPLILVITAVIPCWLNARRAARIEPVVALRID